MKNILITGVSKGVGLKITQLLLEKNYRVYGISRSTNDQLSLLKKQYKGSFYHKSFDLARCGDIQQEVFKSFAGNDIPLHGLVNNAALAYDDIATNINIDTLANMYRINVYAPFILVKYAIRNVLLNKTNLSIVNISSISAHTGYKGLSMYASTKGALEAFSKNIAREWGERNVRSNAVIPGFMDTEMSAGLSYEQKDRIYKRTSQKKSTDINSVAATVEFLLSDISSSITGQNIHVDAGTI